MAGFLVWRAEDDSGGPGGSGSTSSMTIPASFDGQWKGWGFPPEGGKADLTATLIEGNATGRLESGDSSCYGGSLAIREASTSEMTMRFTSNNPTCPKWTVVLRHLSDAEDKLRMDVDPDTADPYRGPFEVPMTRSD